MADQGLATFPGVVQVISCRYTRSLGTQPDYAILRIIPQSFSPQPTGTLQFTYGANYVNLFNCKVDWVRSVWSATSGIETFVKILDRRWAWQAGGEISGRYNVRFVDGSLDTSTEKSPQQLATILLNAMGEQNFDVSALPNSPRPYVSWDYSHPASELDELCELLGCRVCLKIASNSVQIVRLGVGALLPQANLFYYTQSFDLSETPDSLKVVGRARYQSKLKLQAVGEEKDGSLKPIADLSYAPADGWFGVSFPFSFITDDEDRKLAQKSVWRYYQIVSQADGTQEVPDFRNVQTIENIKPIDDFLVEVYTDSSGVKFPKKAFIDGIWFNGDPQAGAGNNTILGTIYEEDFRIDRDNGLVIFPVQVYQWDSGTRTEAELYLTCSYEARDPDTLSYARYIQVRNLGGNSGTGPRIIKRDDILFTSYAQYSRNQKTGTVNNQATVEQQAINQLDATQLEYFPSLTLDAGYNGIVPIDVDGAIRQVTYKVDCSDKSPRGGAETFASVNSETDPYVPRYGQRQISRRSRRGRSRIGIRQRFPR